MQSKIGTTDRVLKDRRNSEQRVARTRVRKAGGYRHGGQDRETGCNSHTPKMSIYYCSAFHQKRNILVLKTATSSAGLTLMVSIYYSAPNKNLKSLT